jgi:hypothetical protein
LLPGLHERLLQRVIFKDSHLTYGEEVIKNLNDILKNHRNREAEARYETMSSDPTWTNSCHSGMAKDTKKGLQGEEMRLNELGLPPTPPPMSHRVAINLPMVMTTRRRCW